MIEGFMHQLRDAGLIVTLDGDGTLHVNGETAPGVAVHLLERIAERKDLIVAHLQDPDNRPLTMAEINGLRNTFQTFREQHGPDLVDAGWTRAEVFNGMDPENPRFVDDISGVMALLWSGWTMQRICRDFLLFNRKGELVEKRHGGGLFGGNLLTK